MKTDKQDSKTFNSPGKKVEDTNNTALKYQIQEALLTQRKTSNSGAPSYACDS